MSLGEVPNLRAILISFLEAQSKPTPPNYTISSNSGSIGLDLIA